jgi:alpha-amylase
MIPKKIVPVIALLLVLAACAPSNQNPADCTGSGDPPLFEWNNATVYFLLTDRFNNADPGNDINFGRTGPTGVNRGFMGGDLKGVTEKIVSGYFDSLGVTALWMTPFFEQIHGSVNEGTGATYGFHGYWTRDWTALDPNFGTAQELRELVQTAHAHDIRIVMDVIVNHTGPVTSLDPVWGDDWVRTAPRCTYQDYASTVTCTLVDNLPDIKTESEKDVMLPDHLLDKWRSEGRLEEELEELDLFFEETGYPRAPKYYIIKWLTDYIREYGINAYRLDTAKHTEEDVWTELAKQAEKAYREWQKAHPGPFDGESFYMVGEVYNYGVSGGRYFNFGDTLVNYFDHGINGLINFEFKWDAQRTPEEIYSKYSNVLNGELEGQQILNYLSSHDDGDPFDRVRQKPFEAATKLLLSPGGAQIYYGDESSRILFTEGAEGDAQLRSFMNWDQIEENTKISGTNVRDVLAHYRKLGTFRKQHPSVGAGVHKMISSNPYVFSRTYTRDDYTDRVVIGLDLPSGEKEVPLGEVFSDGTELIDAYSDQVSTVSDGKVVITSDGGIVLLSCYGK